MYNQNLKNNKSIFSFNTVFEMALKKNHSRHKEIIKLRYGIKDEKPHTLEEIGKKHNITRERVRQIISELFRKAKKQKEEIFFQEVKEKINLAFNQKSGIIKKKEIESLFAGASESERGSFHFFLDLFDELTFYEIKDELEGSYANQEFNLEHWKIIKNSAKEILLKKGCPLSEKDLARRVLKILPFKISTKKLFDFLSVSQEIKKNNFGKWGLAEWKEINPKGTRERIYLVLKENKKPLHFREIAALIDQYKLGKKKAHPQTVHNELIKDKRFVLVGRGTYGLAEWGYKPGTVRELVEIILKENNNLMSREQILEKILSMRQVKKSTVIINLNNFFKRVGKNYYTIK